MRYAEAAAVARSCDLCLLTSKIAERYALCIDLLRETIIMAINQKNIGFFDRLSEDSNTVSGAKGQRC
jgi:hypothetical protein